jgi:hypothetical protein
MAAKVQFPTWRRRSTNVRAELTSVHPTGVMADSIRSNCDPFGVLDALAACADDPTECISPTTRRRRRIPNPNRVERALSLEPSPVDSRSSKATAISCSRSDESILAYEDTTMLRVRGPSSPTPSRESWKGSWRGGTQVLGPGADEATSFRRRVVSSRATSSEALYRAAEGPQSPKSPFLRRCSSRGADGSASPDRHSPRLTSWGFDVPLSPEQQSRQLSSRGGDGLSSPKQRSGRRSSRGDGTASPASLRRTRSKEPLDSRSNLKDGNRIISQLQSAAHRVINVMSFLPRRLAGSGEAGPTSTLTGTDVALLEWEHKMRIDAKLQRVSSRNATDMPAAELRDKNAGELLARTRSEPLGASSPAGRITAEGFFTTIGERRQR